MPDSSLLAHYPEYIQTCRGEFDLKSTFCSLANLFGLGVFFRWCSVCTVAEKCMFVVLLNVYVL